MAYRSVGDEAWQAPVARFPYSVLYVIEPDDRQSAYGICLLICKCFTTDRDKEL